MSKVGDPRNDAPVRISRGISGSYSDSKDAPEEDLRQILDEYVDHSSMHGVWRAAKSTYTRRTLWVLAVVGMISVFVFTFMSQLLLYFEYRITTVVTVEEKSSLPFPAVTICNYNSFRRSLAVQRPDVVAVLQDLFSLDRILEQPDPTVLTDNDQEDLDIQTELIDLAHTLEDMMLFCHWCGVPINCQQYFVQTLTDFGVCYTFNARDMASNASLRVNDAGTECSLRLLVNIQRNEYFYGRGDSTGIKFLVHDPDEVPLVLQHGLSAAPGTTVIAAITLQQEISAKYPYGNCVEHDDQSLDKKIRHHNTYTYTACKLEQRVDYIYNICHCVLYYHPIESRAVCKSVGQVECANQAAENHTLHQLQEMKSRCPVTCVYNTYDVRLSWAAFPAPHILQQMQDLYNMSTNDISENLLQLQVYYEDTAIHRREQRPEYTATALFADVGGQMGLCIGASLLTLVELLELCVQLVRLSCSKLHSSKTKSDDL